MVLATLALALVFGAAGVGLAAAQPSPLPSGPDTCRSGFVWREATPADHVCIQQGPGLPDVRKQIQEENAAAAENRAGKGRLGPDTCKSGFVWRETTPVDHVCVSPQRRDEVKKENGNAIINMLYPPAQPSRGLVARQGGKSNAVNPQMRCPFRGDASCVELIGRFTPKREVKIYLWADYREKEMEKLMSTPVWTYTANSKGKLRRDTLDGGTLLPLPCWEGGLNAAAPKKATVIVLDVGTGVVSNVGKVGAPCE